MAKVAEALTALQKAHPLSVVVTKPAYYYASDGQHKEYLPRPWRAIVTKRFGLTSSADGTSTLRQLLPSQNARPPCAFAITPDGLRFL